MKNYFKINCDYTIMGKLQDFKGETSIINPTLVKNRTNIESSEKIMPKYPLKSGITNSLIAKLVNYVLKDVVIDENLPEWIINRYKLCSLDRAIRVIHDPSSMKELQEARRRLKFQELFTYSLKILMLKDYFNENKKGIAFKISDELKFLKEKLPYALTKAQNRVIREILIDQKRKAR